MFPQNLINKPLFIVNGGRRPAVSGEPRRAVRRAAEAAGRRRRVPAAAAGGATSVVARRQGRVRTVVADHPCAPLPDALSREAGPPNLPSRAHWLAISAAPRPTARRAGASRREHDVHACGSRLGTPPGRASTASSRDSRTPIRFGLRSADVVVAIAAASRSVPAPTSPICFTALSGWLLYPDRHPRRAVRRTPADAPAACRERRHDVSAAAQARLVSILVRSGATGSMPKPAV